MALQSSGQIKLSEIATELGASQTNISLASLSDTAGFSAPDAMTDFYGYSNFTSKYYWNFADNQHALFYDIVGYHSSYTEDISISLWIRPSWANTDVNSVLVDLAPVGASTTANRFFLQYDFGLDRLIGMYRSNSTNFTKHWKLADNNSVTGTSPSKWHSTNRGNTNSDGFVHLVLTYDGSQSTSANAFKCYWNGSELTTAVSGTPSGTRSNFNRSEFGLNATSINGSGDRDAEYDIVSLWQGKLLSSSEVSDLYNSGAPTTASSVGLTTNLDLELQMETTTLSDDTSTWTLSSSAGSRTAY